MCAKVTGTPFCMYFSGRIFGIEGPWASFLSDKFLISRLWVLMLVWSENNVYIEKDYFAGLHLEQMFTRRTLRYRKLELLFQEYSEQDHAIFFFCHTILFPLFSSPLFFTAISDHLHRFSDPSPSTRINGESSCILPAYSNKGEEHA